MTITDNGRRTRTRGELIEQARLEIGDGPLPSRTALSKSLKTHFTIASEIHDLLSAERRREAARRHKARRAEAETKAPPRWVSKATVITPAAPFITPSEPAAEPVNEPVSQPVNERPKRGPVTWPLYLLALPAFAAVWSGWVGLGGLTGFGLIQPFPGIPVLQGIELDTRITLPIGVETYGAYALYVWLSGSVSRRARRFAMWSALGSLALGAAGQITYHLLVSDGRWLITTAVSCLPVAVLGMGAALRHLVHAEEA